MIIFVVTYPSDFEYGVWNKKYFMSYKKAVEFKGKHNPSLCSITTIETED